MLKVGLTGGIGSGKSLICKVFEIFGVPVYYADAEAGRLMESDPVIRNKIIRKFGREMYTGNQLNRKKLASLIFHDKNSLNYLNSIVHPVVRRDFDMWSKEIKNCKYLIEEAAILIETGAYKNFDFVLTVSAPEDLRISRVMERDQVSREKVLERMQNQLSEEERNKRADAVIVNDDTKLVIPQVLQIHQRLIRMSEA